MHAADVKASLWHRRCFCQIELVKRSCWSFSPPKIASRPPFPLAQRLFFQDAPLSLNHSLTRHLLTYQRTFRGCSQKILGDLTLRFRTERVRWLQFLARVSYGFILRTSHRNCFTSDLPCRRPAAEVLAWIFFLHLKLSQRKTFSSRMHHLYQSNETTA